VEPAYRRQLEFLRKLAMDELRKGLAGLKYNWELVPGLAKVRRTGRVPSHFQIVQSVVSRPGWLWRPDVAIESRASAFLSGRLLLCT
jgi:hypothetical protein